MKRGVMQTLAKIEAMNVAKMQEKKTETLPEEGEIQFGQKTIARQECS
jgi:hypothetical protein